MKRILLLLSLFTLVLATAPRAQDAKRRIDAPVFKIGVLGGVGLRHENSPGYLEALQSLYAEIARELSRDVLFVPEAMEGVLGVPEMTSSDGMHPNAEGYRKLAQNLHNGAFAGTLDILKSAQKIPTE